MIKKLGHLSYEERLRELELSIQEEKVWENLFNVFKYLTGKSGECLLWEIRWKWNSFL